MNIIKEKLISILKETVANLEADNTNLNEEQMVRIAEILTHREVSKEEAAIHLKLSTSRFDALIKEGKYPKGRKIIGFKEKRWYIDEIDKCKERLNKSS